MRMKIIHLFSFLLIFSGIKAQLNNWDSVVVDGFGNNQYIYELCTFNNSIYAGTQQISAGVAPNIYSSASGNFGTWSATSFSLTASFNDIRVQDMVADNSNMYVATQNTEDGASVYSFDGTTWTNLSGVVPPWDSAFADVSKLVLYSQGPGTDTLFVFLNNFSTSTAQVWKTSVSAVSWSLVTQTTNTIGIINDAIVYNDSLFFATYDYNTSSSFVYKMTGIGDTMRTHSNSGIDDSYNEITAFGIHNNLLHVGARNGMTGSHLLTYSANGWNVINNDGFGYGYDYTGIVSIHSFRNRIWVGGMGQYSSFDESGARINGSSNVQGGAATIVIFVSNDGVNFHQAANSGFRDYYNFADEWELVSQGDNLYAGGPNYSSYGGQIWQQNIPLANFTTDFDTTCVGMFENYYNASSNAASYKWYVNGTLIGSGLNASYAYPATGTYTISLVAFSTDMLNSDSAAIVKTVTSGLNFVANSFSTCENTDVQLGTITSASVSGGTTPYSYNWMDGFNNTFSTANPTYNAAISTTFTVTVTDVHSCVATQTLSVSAIASTDLSGTVTTALPSAVDNGFVYAFKYQPGGAGYDTIAMVNLQSVTGTYLFPALTAGTYLIKVLPDETAFPLAVPTYYGNTFQWDSSIVVNHGCNQNDVADIEILEASTATGPGTISGYVIEGEGFGTGRFFGSGTQPNIPFVPGGPLKGIDVKLGKNPGSGIQARVMTDSTGYYEFDNLPLQGYKIYVDIPNLPMDSTRELVLAVGNEVSVQNNYFADSATVYILDSVVAVGIYASEKTFENKFSIYPNPAKDVMNISFEQSASGKASLQIMNAMGQAVWQLHDRKYDAGSTIISLQLHELNLSAGVYFLNLISEGRKYTQRLVVIE